MTQFITLSKRAINISGDRFGRLVAIGPVGRSPKSGIQWLCRCDCGKTTIVVSPSLRTGRTKSCGCIQKEFPSRGNTTHGMSRQPLYQVWYSIIRRCTNPDDKRYPYYGGRGITICEEWRHGFKAFHDYVSQLPHCGEKGYSLDRINAGYSPGNVRFSTSKEQSRNKRNNRMITHDGLTMCLTDWATRIQVPYGTLYDRLYVQGWDAERALTTPNQTP